MKSRPLYHELRNTANTSGYPVQYLAATRSYNDLNALNDKLANNDQQLAASGVHVNASWPDPVTDTVMVSLDPPSGSDLTAVGGPAEAPVTSSTYDSAAAGVVTSQVGSGYTIDSQYGSAWRADVGGRRSDKAPFTGSAAIRGGKYNVACSSGFGVKGNASGRAFMFTAGHCASGTWKTGATTLGSTSSVYFRGGSTNDFQTISMSSGSGQVYGNTRTSTSRANCCPPSTPN